MASDLKALRDIISSSVDKIVGVCASTGKDFPSLDQPIQFSEFSPDGIRNHPDVADNVGLIVAAAFQLIATVQPPASTLTTSAFRFSLPVALGIAEATHVAEIIRPAGTKGVHITDIAKKSGADPKKLARVLRFLATNHWFREVAPDTFATNLLSSLLDTGKEVTDDFATTKHKDSPGLAAIAGYASDECIKAAICLKDIMLDPKTALSEEDNETGFQKALGTTKSQWEYYDSPEGAFRRERFSVAMMPKGGLVVDVGGSAGHVSLEIAKANPELVIAVEDRAPVVARAEAYWTANLPSHISSGKVHFIGTDFFERQPKLPATPAVFLMRTILHDWSDKYSIKILRNLRAAAGPETKLVLVDSIIDYACDAPNQSALLSKGPKPPAPLLPNMGGANLLSYEVDLVILASLNSGERTIDGYISIIEAGGLEAPRGAQECWEQDLVAESRLCPCVATKEGVAETQGSEIQNAPATSKKRRVQITQFITCPRPDRLDDSIWARISDKQYEVPVKLTSVAVTTYNRKHGVRDAMHARRLTNRRYAVAFVKDFKPIFVRVPLENVKGMSIVEHLALEVDFIDIVGSDHEGLFGRPRDIEQDEDVGEWVAGLSEGGGGGGGNVLKVSKSFLSQTGSMNALNDKLKSANTPLSTNSAATENLLNKNAYSSLQCYEKNDVASVGRESELDAEVDLLENWKRKWKVRLRLLIAEQIWPCLIDVPHEVQVKHDQIKKFGKFAKITNQDASIIAMSESSDSVADEDIKIRGTKKAPTIASVYVDHSNIEESVNARTSIVLPSEKDAAGSGSEKVEAQMGGSQKPLLQSTPSDWTDSDRASEDEDDEDKVEGAGTTPPMRHGSDGLNDVNHDEDVHEESASEYEDEESSSDSSSGDEYDEDVSENEEMSNSEGKTEDREDISDSNDEFISEVLFQSQSRSVSRSISPLTIPLCKKDRAENLVLGPPLARPEEAGTQLSVQDAMETSQSQTVYSGAVLSRHASACIDTAPECIVGSSVTLDSSQSLSLSQSQVQEQLQWGTRPMRWRRPLALHNPQLTLISDQENDEHSLRILVPDSDASGNVLSQSQSQSLSQFHSQLQPEQQSQPQPSVPIPSNSRSAQSQLNHTPSPQQATKQAEAQNNSQPSSITQEDSRDIILKKSQKEEITISRDVLQTPEEPETLVNLGADDAVTRSVLYHSSGVSDIKNEGMDLDVNESRSTEPEKLHFETGNVQQTAPSTYSRKQPHSMSAAVHPDSNSLDHRRIDTREESTFAEKKTPPPSTVVRDENEHNSIAWQAPSFIQRRTAPTHASDLIQYGIEKVVEASTSSTPIVQEDELDKQKTPVSASKAYSTSLTSTSSIATQSRLKAASSIGTRQAEEPFKGSSEKQLGEAVVSVISQEVDNDSQRATSSAARPASSIRDVRVLPSSVSKEVLNLDNIKVIPSEVLQVTNDRQTSNIGSMRAALDLVDKSLVRHGDLDDSSDIKTEESYKQPTLNSNIPLTPMILPLNGFTVNLKLRREPKGPQWLSWNDMSQILLDTGRKRHQENFREEERLTRYKIN
ncbi:hypothetical protein EW145_g3108 [Phellinidium pouzarii]|uniref:O-methyltransferase C-terminal domain-containing protein n=1 Tax=Phellinidium pouzarii TaxID=167371 RepID=A0A4S4L8A1_9AGAM|nr:hypothetical protein EW145_g3108 [Phellinidium pouzarii]